MTSAEQLRGSIRDAAADGVDDETWARLLADLRAALELENHQTHLLCWATCDVAFRPMGDDSPPLGTVIYLRADGGTVIYLGADGGMTTEPSPFPVGEVIEAADVDGATECVVLLKQWPLMACYLDGERLNTTYDPMEVTCGKCWESPNHRERMAMLREARVLPERTAHVVDSAT